jgi:hypothetical protein
MIGDSGSRQSIIPDALSGRYIHVPAFARFADTLSVDKKASVLTLPLASMAASEKWGFRSQLATFAGGHIHVPGFRRVVTLAAVSVIGDWARANR